MSQIKLPGGRSKDVLIEPRKKLSEKDLKDILRNCGLKTTLQRMAILNALNNGPRVHMTAQDIHQEAKKETPVIGFATIYRFVKKLQAQGMIFEISMGSGSSRYELKPKKSHYHISCVKCGTVIEFKNKDIENKLERIVKEYKFQMEHQVLELYVRCHSKKCAKED